MQPVKTHRMHGMTVRLGSCTVVRLGRSVKHREHGVAMSGEAAGHGFERQRGAVPPPKVTDELLEAHEALIERLSAVHGLPGHEEANDLVRARPIGRRDGGPGPRRVPHLEAVSVRWSCVL